MKLAFIILIIGAFSFPLIGKADVIAFGQHSVATCYEITNLNEYPEYTFLLIGEGAMESARVLGQSDCTSFYKFSTGTFAAVKNDLFNTLLGEHYSVQDGTIWDLSTDAGAQDWVQNYKHQFIFAEVTPADHVSSVSDTNPLEKISYQYRIEGINENQFFLSLSGAEYTYENGIKQQVSVDHNGQLPNPLNFLPMTWILLLTTGASLLLVLFLHTCKQPSH